MADEVRSSKADDLADELTRARQRGISAIEERGRTRSAVALPILEDLAARSDNPTARTRVEQLRQFLDRELTRYAEGSPDDAALIRRLFEDPEGRWPGPGGPGYLLDRVRKEWGPADPDQFRRLQRRQLLGFARFLLGVEEAHADGAVAADVPAGSGSALKETVDRRRYWWALIAGALILIALGVVASGLLSGDEPEAKSAAGSTQTSTPTPTGNQVMFRFDALGSTETDIIQVYPGGEPTPEDRTPIGTYKSGLVVKAVCVTTGRLVRSDPKFEETPKESDQWVRIDYVPGVPQYATLTYGELIPANAKLPDCSTLPQG